MHQHKSLEGSKQPLGNLFGSGVGGGVKPTPGHDAYRCVIEILVMANDEYFMNNSKSRVFSGTWNSHNVT